MRVLALVPVLVLAASPAQAGDTIHVRPGQCILVGSQEVCALRCDDAAATPAPAPRPTTMATCKYGPRPDDAAMKGYTLVQMIIKDDGSKHETVIKTFGSMPADKAECEREARRLDDRR